MSENYEVLVERFRSCAFPLSASCYDDDDDNVDDDDEWLLWHRCDSAEALLVHYLVN